MENHRSVLQRLGRRKNNQAAIVLLCGLSLSAFFLVKIFPGREARSLKETMIEAAAIMEGAAQRLVECRREKGLPAGEPADLNQTGFIGLEQSPLTTTLGNLEAKRTTANPNFAALVVLLLHRAGVRAGDTIAVGASSSFPALVVAVLSASRAMRLAPLLISSLGASQWGGNHPEFHLLDMEDCLLEAGVFSIRPVAVSVGGDHDRGDDMETAGRDLIIREVRERGLLLLESAALPANVAARMRMYKEAASGNPIRAFINIGGSWSNLGTSAEVLKVKPGLAGISSLPPPGQRGVMFEMAAEGVPVIHLLYVKGLADEFGLPWDPVPLPRPGEGGLYGLARKEGAAFTPITGGYFALVILVVLLFTKRNRSRLKELSQ